MWNSHKRHTFATATFAHGDYPERVLSLLATWLGQSDATHTYWYLTAAGELMALAAGMLDSARTEQESL